MTITFGLPAQQNSDQPVAVTARLPVSRFHGPFSVVGMSLTMVLAMAGQGTATEYTIGPKTEIKSLVKNIVAGDTVILQNGEWRDSDLKFEQLPGTADAPIAITAQTPGKVILTGETEFRLSGTHAIVSGLIFRNPRGISDVIQLRTHSERLAHKCRITNCIFEESVDSHAGQESRWLSIYGTKNRVDHCYFAGKKNKGTTLVVWLRSGKQSPVAGHHQIDRNYFGPRPELGKNGGETIRIGTSATSELTSNTLVLENFFHRCNGEAETISNKSCGNEYRRNVFDECGGTLTLRHGHRCLVNGNAFLGRKRKGTGGVRIIGESHTVTNNYFDGLRGDAERAAVCMMNGIPNSPLNEYAPVRNAVVAHNCFVDCKVSLEIGVGAGKKQSAAPAKCTVHHNVFLQGKWELSRVHATPVDFAWRANLQQQGQERPHALADIGNFEIRDLGFQRSSDGLMRPSNRALVSVDEPSEITSDFDGSIRDGKTICGCHSPESAPRPLVTATNTGPTWMQQHGTESVEQN